MSTTFKPLLAATIEDTDALMYPCMVSEKLDGIRCIVIDKVAYSRTLKPIRNQHVQRCLGTGEYDGLDGELIVGDKNAKTCYRTTNSGIMSEDGIPDFSFHIFDRIDMPLEPFFNRFNALPTNLAHTTFVPHWIVQSSGELLVIEQKLLEKGAEGVMVRSVGGLYKQGRSTLKDGILGKLKRFVDHDYLVVGLEERMENRNEATIDELGYTKRSSHEENKVGRGDLGALVLETEGGVRFSCGTGFDDATRKEIWENPSAYVGKYAKIKSFPVGIKELPRFPVFLGFREDHL